MGSTGIGEVARWVQTQCEEGKGGLQVSVIKRQFDWHASTRGEDSVEYAWSYQHVQSTAVMCDSGWLWLPQWLEKLYNGYAHRNKGPDMMLSSLETSKLCVRQISSLQTWPAVDDLACLSIMQHVGWKADLVVAGSAWGS